jgi:hypothetical protein
MWVFYVVPVAAGALVGGIILALVWYAVRS